MPTVPMPTLDCTAIADAPAPDITGTQEVGKEKPLNVIVQIMPAAGAEPVVSIIFPLWLVPTRLIVGDVPAPALAVTVGAGDIE